MLFSLPQRTRISKKAHFQYTFTHCKRRDNPLVRAYAGKAFKEDGCSAFIASKKVGNAVVRNRCKRRMKEMFRQIKPQLKENMDIILVAKSGLLSVTYEEASRQLFRLFRDLSLVRMS